MQQILAVKSVDPAATTTLPFDNELVMVIICGRVLCAVCYGYVLWLCASGNDVLALQVRLVTCVKKERNGTPSEFKCHAVTRPGSALSNKVRLVM